MQHWEGLEVCNTLQEALCFKLHMQCMHGKNGGSRKNGPVNAKKRKTDPVHPNKRKKWSGQCKKKKKK